MDVDEGGVVPHAAEVDAIGADVYLVGMDVRLGCGLRELVSSARGDLRKCRFRIRSVEGSIC